MSVIYLWKCEKIQVTPRNVYICSAYQPQLAFHWDVKFWKMFECDWVIQTKIYLQSFALAKRKQMYRQKCRLDFMYSQSTTLNTENGALKTPIKILSENSNLTKLVQQYIDQNSFYLPWAMNNLQLQITNILQ